MKTVAISRQGSRSETNEDACVVLSMSGVFVVADGVGGGPAGELASRCVVDVLSDCLSGNEITDQAIDSALKKANHKVRDLAVQLNNEGMASTVVLAWILDDVLRCYHVGDSRIYRLRSGQLERLTRDHTRVVRQVGGAEKLVVTQAVGAKDDVFPDVTEHDWVPGDVLLLMSDGITDLVSDDEMLTLFGQNRTMADRANALIARSEQLGGTDDKTVVIVFN